MKNKVSFFEYVFCKVSEDVNFDTQENTVQENILKEMVNEVNSFDEVEQDTSKEIQKDSKDEKLTEETTETTEKTEENEKLEHDKIFFELNALDELYEDTDIDNEFASNVTKKHKEDTNVINIKAELAKIEEQNEKSLENIIENSQNEGIADFLDTLKKGQENLDDSLNNIQKLANELDGSTDKVLNTSKDTKKNNDINEVGLDILDIPEKKSNKENLDNDEKSKVDIPMI